MNSGVTPIVDRWVTPMVVRSKLLPDIFQNTEQMLKYLNTQMPSGMKNRMTILFLRALGTIENTVLI